MDLVELVRGLLFQRQRRELAETDTFQTTTQLNIGIQGPDALRVRNNVANLQGDVDLTVRGTLARPAIFGDGHHRLRRHPGLQRQRVPGAAGALTFSNPTGSIR